jgi:tRNA threonylcarbamoyladenosine biosynthesis protein TsaB
VIILALDTTTRGGSVAVADGDRMLAVLRGDESRTHGERLPGELARALEQAGITRDQIDLLAVATGPGAFTGLRIGLAAIQGLAMTLNKPVIGISALDALAEQVASGEPDLERNDTGVRAERTEAEVAAERIEAQVAAKRSEAGVLLLPWMDAQRGDVFATLIDRATGITIEPPTAASPQQLLDSWRPHLAGRDAIFIGDAAARDATVIARSSDGRWQTRTPAPLAPQIARLGHRRARLGDAGLPHTLEPIYVRRPDAEIERERTHKHR